MGKAAANNMSHLTKKQFIESIKDVLPVDVRTNQVGTWYTSTNSKGFRWLIGMPEQSQFDKNELPVFRAHVQKRFQLTKTHKGFRFVKTHVVDGLTLRGLLTAKPEDYI